MATKKAGVAAPDPGEENAINLRDMLTGSLKLMGLEKLASSIVVVGKDFTDVEFLPTGQIEVDAILGEGGGIPRGTLLELAGESQSGKTYLGYKLIAEAHKRGERALFVNIENGFYQPRAIACGVEVTNPNKFAMIQNIEFAEHYCELIEQMIESKLFAVIVVDSITALVPQEEMVKDFDDKQMIGGHARLINRFLKKIGPACNRSKTICVLINQMRMQNSSMPNQPMREGSTGGKSVEFFTHMRLKSRRVNGKEGAVVGEGGEVIGGKTHIQVLKTRYGTPGVFTTFPIMFEKQKVNLVGEFLYRASARGKDYVSVYRKEYRYADVETGEVLAASKDPAEFVELLRKAPVGHKLTRGDNSTTAFEYICGRLKMNESQMNDLIAALTEPVEDVIAPTDTSSLQMTGEYGDESDDVEIPDDESDVFGDS